MTMDAARRQFVLGQYDLYGWLSLRVVEMRHALGRGEDLAAILVRETELVLGSDMTREQIASALVSVMMRQANGLS